ncbi:MAG: 6-bladed beta-propeller [Verrucomicrobia bacterium]|nr:6-bladed beta-propeller [Verrucomicrobiota bacterium]
MQRDIHPSRADNRLTALGRWRLLLGAAVLGTIVSVAVWPATRLAAADKAAPAKAPPRTWPAPPAEPRVAFVQCISSPADFGVRPSFWGRIGNFFTGRNRAAQKLVKPTGIALDEAGNICLTDTGEGTVCFFERAAKRYQRWSKIGPHVLQSPVAIARRNGVFYVADSGLRKVLVFRSEKELLFEISSDIQRPCGLAIAGDRLYVADAVAHGVAVFDLRGKFLFRFGKRGSGPGEFNFPSHIAADSNGRLYVTDSMNGRVEMFDGEGRFQGMVGSLGDTSGHFSRPKGVAVDALFDNIQIFDQQGRFLLDIGKAGSETGEFWLPAGIAISRDNEICVADSYNCRIQVFKYVGKS